MKRGFGRNSGRNTRFTLVLIDWGICNLLWSGVKHYLLNNVYWSFKDKVMIWEIRPCGKVFITEAKCDSMQFKVLQ